MPQNLRSALLGNIEGAGLEKGCYLTLSASCQAGSKMTQGVIRRKKNVYAPSITLPPMNVGVFNVEGRESNHLPKVGLLRVL